MAVEDLQLLEQLDTGIAVMDAAGIVVRWNAHAERILGLSAKEAVGRPLAGLLSVVRGENIAGSEVRAAAMKPGGWQGLTQLRVPSGADVWVRAHVQAMNLSPTDEQPGMIALLWPDPGPAAVDTDSDALALVALAVATTRARTRQEVASSVLERLCEITRADFGAIATWAGEVGQQIEASRGLNEDFLQATQDVVLPELRAALDATPIVSVGTIGKWLAGTDAADAMARSGIASGFLVALRVRDDQIGFLALGSRQSTWTRPRDEVLLQMAAQIANAMENARLMERLEQGLDQERRLTARLETLMGLTLLPTGDTSEEAVARVLLERIVAAIEADGAFVVREADNRLQVVASRHLPDSMRIVAESRPADSFAFWRRLKTAGHGGAFQERIAVPAGAEPEYGRMADLGVTGLAVFPVREGDRLVGAFLCYFTGSFENRSPVDDRDIEAVGRIISIAYANVGMSEGLAEAAEHERHLRAELQAVQELILLGASTDDMGRLAEETIQEVVLATGATGGGYILVDPSSGKVDPVAWVGPPSRSWPDTNEWPQVPADWPSFGQLQSENGTWLSRSDEVADDASTQDAQALLPLCVDDRLAGVLHLEWSESPRGEQYDVHFLEPIARICSVSLANFRLRSELLDRAAAQRALGHRLDTLDELTRIGEEASSFEELAHRTVSLVREALGASGVCYLLIEPGHHFETSAVAGETGAFRLWLKGVPAKDAPGGSLLLSGSGSVLADFVATQVNARVLPLARATGFLSFGAIPIRTGEELAGALLCFFAQPVARLPLDESALDSVARIASIALANYRLRERLVTSEERYRTLFEESPDALLVSALDGTVLDANEAAVRLYRVNRGEVLGRYFGQLISADEREMARRRQIVWAQGRGTFRDRGRRPDGSEFPLEVEVRVVELGGQRRFLQLVRDLSDQERLQRELLQAQKMEAIGQLVSGVAHELNNPLAAIVAFSQLLRGDARLPEDMRHDAGLLVQESDRTRRIVQGLLDFARARPPERRPTNINVLVQSVLELQSYALSTNKILVKVDIPASLPEVDLDRAQLQQVLLNLTINAIQAIRECVRSTPAHLWISAGLGKTRSSSVASKAEKAYGDQPRVRITIRDDGPGVPESARGRLFDPFFTTKQPGEGTGLGLSVSFGIVAAHDGNLWYEPGPGNVGSSFIMELPVTARSIDEPEFTQTRAFDGAQGGAFGKPRPREPRAGQVARRPPAEAAAGVGVLEEARGRRRAAPAAKASAETPAAPAAKASAETPAAPAAKASAETPAAPAAKASAETPAAPAAARPRIIAVDDEPAIGIFLRKALTAAGMDCTVYRDGPQALDALRDASFDIMLIDNLMAGMSGTEFYELAMRIRPELARRAILMSGDVLNPDLQEFATQRAIRLLAKPFDLDTVVGMAREVMADPETAGAAKPTSTKPATTAKAAAKPTSTKPATTAKAAAKPTSTKPATTAKAATRAVPGRPPDPTGAGDAQGHRSGPTAAWPGPAQTAAAAMLAAAPTKTPAAAPAQAPAAAAPARTKPRATRRPRILVVDDEPSIRAFLNRALTAAGMECLGYEDGASALEGIRKTGDFDAMLIDHRLVGISGTEFFQAAVKLRPEMVSRAVFMSGDVLNPDLHGFATQRGIRLLAKPFDVEAVIATVRKLIVDNSDAESSPDGTGS